jgi:acyl carrier protein phosphodiesterase
MLDLFFDHILASQFQRFHGQESLGSFAQRVHLALQAHQDYPAKGWRIVDHLVADRWLENYVQLQGLQPALDYLSARLGRSNPLPAALYLFPAMQEALSADFHCLLPDLRVFAREFAAGLADTTLA